MSAADHGCTPEQNVGICAQQPTLQRWDNPIPMPCGHYMTRASGAYLGSNARHCSADAFWVYVRGEDVIDFRCHHHKHDVPA